MAAPFVQGRLREHHLSLTIETECAHCQRPLHLTVDSDMGFRVHEAQARPLVFEPHVDWQTFREPTIIDAY